MTAATGSAAAGIPAAPATEPGLAGLAHHDDAHPRWSQTPDAPS